MLSLDNLRVLETIAQSGSFAAAGELLHKVPSAISYSINKLEQELSIVIFDRQGHKARLTPAGAAVLREGQKLLQQAEELRRCAQSAQAGWEPELRIALDTLLPLSALHPLIHEFQRLDIPTELCFSHEVLAGCWEALSLGRADLIIGASGDPPSSLHYAPLGDMPMHLSAAPNHPLSQLQRKLQPQDLQGHYAVVISDSSRLWPSRTLGLFPGQKLLRVSDLASKIDAIRQGLGIGFLPATHAPRLFATGELTELNLQPLANPGQLYLGWKSLGGQALNWWRERITLGLWL